MQRFLRVCLKNSNRRPVLPSKPGKGGGEAAEGSASGNALSASLPRRLQCHAASSSVSRRLRITVLCSIAILFGAGCRRETPQAPAAASSKPKVIELSPNDVGEVTSQKLLAGVRVTGTLNPSVRVGIKALVSGLVLSTDVDRGMVVTQSQVLAVADDRTAKAQVDSLKAQLAAAEREFSASELLYKAGAASQRAYINAKVNVESAKAQLAQGEQSVDRATIRSPISGVVSERAIAAGESISPGQQLFTVVNSETLECIASVLPSEVVHIATGQPVVLNLSGVPDLPIDGAVQRIDPIADPKSRRVGVYITVANKGRRLVAGLFATGTILTNSAAAEQKVLLMPQAALRDENGAQVVYAIENGRLARRPVQVDAQATEEGRVEVKSGLTAGTKVVLSFAQALSDGIPVKLLSPEKP